VTGLAAAALSAAYAGKIMVVVGRRPSAKVEAGYDEEQVGTRHVGLAQRGPLVLLAAAAAVLGLLALPPVGDRLRSALGDTLTPTAATWELVLSAGLTLAVLGAVVVALSGRWRVPRPRWAALWLGLEHAANILVVAPTMALARTLARFDDRVLDRAVDTSAILTGELARRLGRLDSGSVDGLVEGVARATRRAGELARRPQTGQLHEYYAQATAILAVGVILLIVVR
jgi:NADH-quinone oxidoreductase subunit L